MFHEQVKRQMQTLNLRGGDLAALVNVSAPKLSNFFKGRIELDAAKRKELLGILNDIERLKSYFPVPIGTHDPKLLALAIERLREGVFEEFGIVTTGTDWEDVPKETKESLERHFFTLFKSKKGRK